MSVCVNCRDRLEDDDPSVRCNQRHTMCQECVEQLVRAAVNDPNNQHAFTDEGALKCMECQQPLPEASVIQLLSFNRELAARFLAVRLDLARRQGRLEAERRQHQRSSSRKTQGHGRTSPALRQRFDVSRLRLDCIENVLTLACPRCNTAFIDFDGCCAVTCQQPYCRAFFCGLCLKLSPTATENHVHVRQCPFSARPDSFFATAQEVVQSQQLLRLCRFMIWLLAKPTLTDPLRKRLFKALTLDFQYLQIDRQARTLLNHFRELRARFAGYDAAALAVHDIRPIVFGILSRHDDEDEGDSFSDDDDDEEDDDGQEGGLDTDDENSDGDDDSDEDNFEDGTGDLTSDPDEGEASDEDDEDRRARRRHRENNDGDADEEINNQFQQALQEGLQILLAVLERHGVGAVLVFIIRWLTLPLFLALQWYAVDMVRAVVASTSFFLADILCSNLLPPPRGRPGRPRRFLHQKGHVQKTAFFMFLISLVEVTFSLPGHPLIPAFLITAWATALHFCFVWPPASACIQLFGSLWVLLVVIHTMMASQNLSWWVILEFLTQLSTAFAYISVARPLLGFQSPPLREYFGPNSTFSTFTFASLFVLFANLPFNLIAYSPFICTLLPFLALALNRLHVF
eukprot:m.238209 g.238209  ORF g.238209 m.238209 type:complete len:628 (-) comp17114_c2_seq1:58-1941(-)